jgi:hypothetical protein
VLGDGVDRGAVVFGVTSHTAQMIVCQRRCRAQWPGEREAAPR